MTFIEQFPILETCTYLNTASSGLISKQQLEWRAGHDQEFFTQGSGFRIKQAEFLQEVKGNLANFFNAKPENTFLVPNFSFGFNTLLAGLESGQRFLLLEEDYPSVNYAIETRGNVCDYVPMSAELEESIIQKIKAFKPTVFAFSLVQYISGIKIDLDFLKELKQLFPELLIVSDGTQFCGAEAFDFEASGLDALLSSGYKWMLSGYGNGFVLLKDQAKEMIYKAAKHRPSPREPFLQGKGILSAYFEPGHLDTLAFGTLDQSIRFFNSIDFEAATAQTKLLSKKAKQAFEARGLLQQTVLDRKDHSSIFNLSVSSDTYEELLRAKVICLQRGPGVRIAFHLYNTEDDLNQLLSVLDAS